VAAFILLSEDSNNETPHGVGLIISILMTYVLLVPDIIFQQYILKHPDFVLFSNSGRQTFTPITSNRCKLQPLDSHMAEGMIPTSESIPDVSVSNVESKVAILTEMYLTFPQLLQTNYWITPENKF
jgi:hypothetical protein